MGKLDQKVLCIATEKLFNKVKWNGIKTDNLDYYYQLLLEHSEFKVRGVLEDDPRYKQIIPQIILRYQSKYFLHRQIGATEQRLNNLCPLPLGGHIEEFDMVDDGKDLIQTAMYRELYEEADVQARITKTTFLGLLYIEDENPVNHVHVGLVYIFDLDSDNVEIHEEGLETIGFVDLDYLIQNRETLTYWSRIIVDMMKAMTNNEL